MAQTMINEQNPFLLSNSEQNALSVRQANRLFRLVDESHLWPVCGRFNATERAIRRVRKARQEGLDVHPGMEYIQTVHNEIVKIVNDI